MLLEEIDKIYSYMLITWGFPSYLQLLSLIKKVSCSVTLAMQSLFYWCTKCFHPKTEIHQQELYLRLFIM